MLDGLDLRTLTGISAEDASARLKTEGFNELPASVRRSIWTIAVEVASEPMFLLLIACGITYLVLGDFKEAVVLMGFVVVVMGITLYQERKTERALEALRDLSSPRALVIRDHELIRIPGREVVRDDLVILTEGDRVPADGVLVSCLNLAVDESLLTGESVPVRKMPDHKTSEMCRPGGDDNPCVFSGTLVVQGRGLARVEATGINTEIGKIGKALQTVQPENTPLQRETSRLVRNIAIVGVSLCAVVVVAYGLSRGNWLDGVLAGITLAMAMLPEEFPVVLTVFLALGAWRMSRKQVLTRRVPVVESLGAATVLCVDKTGTLTLNRMSVGRLYANGSVLDLHAHGNEPLPELFHELLEFAILAGKRNPFDPMEKELRRLGDAHLAHTEHLHDHWNMVQEYPLSKKLLALSHVWQAPYGTGYCVAAKGAPEAIVDLCHLDARHARDIEERVSSMASEGLRVLGVAKTIFADASLPGEQHDFPFEFLGLVGFSDPVRPGVPEALRECYDAGIRVLMITGDYPETAQSVARHIGLEHPERCLSGPEMEDLDDSALQARVKEVNVFARVVPEQKLRLVEALKNGGEIVAMTGDGVNDAPALKSAHIGIAMGGRGTDVAREASDLVLIDDDFSSIVRAVRQGRRIFDNLRKAMVYICAIHVPIAGMSFLPVICGWPLVLYPVHVAFLELIIDPACSLVFEAEQEEGDLMHRAPRVANEPLFGAGVVGLSLGQGLALLLCVVAVFVIALHRGHNASDARAMTFATLILGNLGLIMANRSWTRTILSTLRIPNPAMWWVVVGAVSFLGLVLYVPYLRDLFHFERLHVLDLVICVAAGGLSITWFEVAKLMGSRRIGQASG
ncbi:MAG: cation-translocating P-type ATPase [Thermodesulfobacteriota bacterium]